MDRVGERSDGMLGSCLILCACVIHNFCGNQLKILIVLMVQIDIQFNLQLVTTSFTDRNRPSNSGSRSGY